MLIVSFAASCHATKKYHVFVERLVLLATEVLSMPLFETWKLRFVPSKYTRYSSDPLAHFPSNPVPASESKRTQPAIVKSMFPIESAPLSPRPSDSSLVATKL